MILGVSRCASGSLVTVEDDGPWVPEELIAISVSSLPVAGLGRTESSRVTSESREGSVREVVGFGVAGFEEISGGIDVKARALHSSGAKNSMSS